MEGDDMAEQPDHLNSSPPLAYPAVTAGIWVIYAALVLLASRVLAFSTPVAVAAITLAAAALLSPPRRWAQRTAKRRFAPR
jgi:hypothetical protein